MSSLPDQICKKCGQGMKLVAEIPPMGQDHGLVAFLCSECGSADTILVDPKKSGESGLDQQGT
jgi:hypothetical protein